jgi:molybdate/tungstate transport system substrate-binding protein
MSSRLAPRRHTTTFVVIVTFVGLVSAGMIGAAPIGATAAASGGPVDVLYAGSLVTIVNNALGPSFDGASHDTLNGFPGGSTALASQIKARTTLADVFISASPAVDATLQGTANGAWVSWYATFATSPLVLAYNPGSRFATQLKTKPWYDVVTQPGFLLGRTDPATDPKGKLAVEALDRAATAEKRPGLAAIAASTAGVYPEETLLGRLQSGQLDAGFFYTSEAIPAGLPVVSLGKDHLDATYTVTVLRGAPHARAAATFVSYLLGPRGRAILRRDGLTVVSPPPVHDASAVPATLEESLHLR